jgi:hypothetical protein
LLKIRWKKKKHSSRRFSYPKCPFILTKDSGSLFFERVNFYRRRQNKKKKLIIIINKNDFPSLVFFFFSTTSVVPTQFQFGTHSRKRSLATSCVQPTVAANLVEFNTNHMTCVVIRVRPSGVCCFYSDGKGTCGLCAHTHVRTSHLYLIFHGAESIGTVTWTRRAWHLSWAPDAGGAQKY